MYWGGGRSSVWTNMLPSFAVFTHGWGQKQTNYEICFSVQAHFQVNPKIGKVNPKIGKVTDPLQKKKM